MATDERRRRRDQRLGHARRNRRQIPRALRRDSEERLDDAEHRAEQADERADRSDRREPWEKTADPIALVRRVAVEHEVESFDL